MFGGDGGCGGGDGGDGGCGCGGDGVGGCGVIYGPDGPAPPSSSSLTTSPSPLALSP